MNKTQRVYWVLLVILWGIPSAAQDNEKEYKNKMESFDSTLRSMEQTLTRPTGDAGPLNRGVENLMKIISWVKDKYPPQRRWAEEARQDMEKFKGYVRDFARFHSLCQKFPQKMDQFYKKLASDVKKILEGLNREIDKLDPDLRKLDQGEKRVDQVRREMNNLGKRTSDFLYKNPDFEQIKNLYDRLKGFSGRTRGGSRLEKSLKQGLLARAAGVMGPYKRLESKIQNAAKGEKFPPFQKSYQEFKGAAKLLRSNAKEILGRNKQLREFRQKVDGALKNLADKILAGKIREALREALGLYNGLLRLDSDIKRSKVLKALKTKWIPLYGKALKNLKDPLQSLEKGESLYSKLNEILSKLPSKASQEVKNVYGRLQNKGDLKELQKGADMLEKKYNTQKRELGKMVYQLRKFYQEAARFQEKGPFEKISSSIKGRVAQSFGSAQKGWKNAYDNSYVQTCLLGRKSKFYRKMEEKIAYNFIGTYRKKFFAELGKIEDKVRGGANIPSSEVKVLQSILREMTKLCQEKKLRPPSWITDAEKILPQIPGWARQMAVTQKEVAQYIKTVRDFVSSATRDYRACISIMQSSNSLKGVIAYRKKVIAASQKHRDSARPLLQQRKKTFQELQKVEKIPRAGGVFGPLTGSLHTLIKRWNDRIKTEERGLRREEVRALMAGID